MTRKHRKKQYRKLTGKGRYVHPRQAIDVQLQKFREAAKLRKEAK